MPNLIAHANGGVCDGGPIRLLRKDGSSISGPVQSVPVRDSRAAISAAS